MVRSIYCRKAKENGYLQYQPSCEHRRRTRGGVATLIACSKPAALEAYATLDPYGHYFGWWFRLYSDGFIEQGILTREYWGAGHADDNTATQFPIPFKDTNYTVSLACNNSAFPFGYRRKTEYSIIAEINNDSETSGAEICITARGFVSQETINNILAGKVWATFHYDGTSPFHVWIDDPNA